MKVILDIEQALMLRKHPVYTVTEHPVIWWNFRAQSVDWCRCDDLHVTAAALTLTQGKWLLINTLYTEYAVSVNTLYLYCRNQRAWSAVGGAAAAVTHARGKMVIKN